MRLSPKMHAEGDSDAVNRTAHTLPSTTIRDESIAISFEGPQSWEEVSLLTKTYGESFYLFNQAKFRDNFSRLRTAFTARYLNTRIAYSYKTNYAPAICRIVNEMGGYAEVVSEMEYDLARKLGISGQHIIYNGPYKSFDSVRDALCAGAIVNLDSLHDYTSVMSVAANAPERNFSVGLRCNLAFPEECTSRFGFDTNTNEFQHVVEGIRASRNVSLSGLHCHLPNRDLESFRLRTVQLLNIAKRLFSSTPVFLNLGGGFFGSMPAKLQRAFKVKPPDFDQYAETICSLLNGAYSSSGNGPVLYIEPGTALVADTLKFYTTVINLKSIRGRRIATVAGSIFNISPYSRMRNLPVRALRTGAANAVSSPEEVYEIAGYTCIEDDYLTRGFPGPLEVGDFLEYSNVGSYSIVMKPPFILPNVPILGISQEGRVCVIRHAESSANLFESFLGLEDEQNAS